MKLTILICLLFLTLNGVSQQVYYISALGDDSNNGTSLSTPWKTIREIEPGNTYLLKRNETFHFNIPVSKKATGNKRTLISAYGSGDDPVLNLYKKIKPESWTQDRSYIWKVDLTNSDNYTGLTSTDTNVGFIKVGGKIYGNKKENISLLTDDWDFSSDSTFLYVYLKSKPSTNVPNVEVSWNVTAIKISKGMTIENIKIMGAGAHGISGLFCENVTLRNLNVTEIGGSYLVNFKKGTTRYGNGIQIGNGSNNCLSENCKVSQVYDAAFTMQGDDPSTHFINTTFKNNTAENNEQSFEVWVKGGGQGFTNCKFINNKCSNAGFGWSHKYRPAQYEGVHLLSYDLDCQNLDLLIEGNIFYRAKSGLYSYSNDRDNPKYISKNNTITLDAKTPIQSMSNITKTTRVSLTNYEAFVKSTGHEKGSKFNTIKTVSPKPQLRH
jgi:hypothetical protein